MITTARAASLLLTAALLLAACGGAAPPAGTSVPGASPTAGQADIGPVTIGFAAQEYERQVYEPLIERFEQENPDVRVQFVPIDALMREQGQGGNIGQINRRIASAADTAAPFFIQAEDIAAGTFADLQPLVDADPSFDPSDFQPGALAAVTVDGGLFAIPRTINVSLLAYNRDLFAARGVAEPTVDTSWGELLALAEQIGERRGGEVETYGYTDWSSGFIPLVGLLGEAGVDLFGTPSDQLRLDDPRIEEAVARLVALGASGAINLPRQDGSGNPGDLQPMIDEGRVAMWPSDMVYRGPDAPPQAFESGVIPMPAVGVPLFGTGQSYVMSAGTQYREQSWRWLSFISRQQVSAPFQQSSPSQVPARQSLAQESGYWGQLDEAGAAAVRAALERQSGLPSLGGFDNRSYEALNRAIVAAAGGDDPATALREAQAGLEEQLASATPSPEPETGPLVVTLPEQQVAAEGAAQITFAVAGVDPSGMRQGAEQFNRENPELFVSIESSMGGPGPMSLASLAESADCFAWFGPPGTEEISATLDLQPLIDASGASLADDYPPQLLEPFRRDGGLYGLPYIVTLRTLAYNRDMFEQAGLEPPTAEWSIEELVQAAEQLSGGAGADRRYGFGTLGPHGEDLTYFVGRAGGSLTTGSGDNLRPTYTDPRVFQGISLYLDLLRRTSPHERIEGYEANSSWGGDIYQLVSEGRVGMWFDRGAVQMFGMGGQDAPNTGVAAPPGLETVRAGDVNPETSLYISAGTEQVQACWRWIEHLSADATQVQYGFPARISAAESEGFAARAPAGAAEVYRVYREAMERTPAGDGAIGRGVLEGLRLEHYWLYRAADNALQGGNLERELAEAQRLAEEHLACTQGGGGPGECAIQVDPDYNGYMRPSE
jgi:ABC-type glycerol-3-phosphate transport system substrate-binding protein